MTGWKPTSTLAVLFVTLDKLKFNIENQKWDKIKLTRAYIPSPFVKEERIWKVLTKRQGSSSITPGGRSWGLRQWCMRDGYKAHA